MASLLRRLLAERSAALTAANRLDLAAAPGFGLTEAQIDRLTLTPARIAAMQKALEEIAALPEPIGEVISSSIRPSGLEVQKVRVPLGVIFFIYESRPNVTTDAAAHLRQERQRRDSSRRERGGPFQCRDRGDPGRGRRRDGPVARRRPVGGHGRSRRRRPSAAHAEYIDLVIPRGGEGLIRRVSEEARMPVMKHFAGNCHVYLDRSADADMAEKIVVNAKCQRMGVCNAAESLVVHAEAAAALLPRMGTGAGPRRRNPRRPADAAMAARRPSRRPRRIIAPNTWDR